MEGPSCDITHDQMALDKAHDYLQEFIDSIKNANLSKLDFENAGPIINFVKLRFKPAKPHTDMEDAVILIEVKNGKLIFTRFTDGLTC